MSTLRRYLPILARGAEYSRQTLMNDQIAAAIDTVMRIPQSPTSDFYEGQNEH